MKMQNTIVLPPHGVTITTPHLEREDEFNRTKFVVNVLHYKQPKYPKHVIVDLGRESLCLHPSSPLYLSKFHTVSPNSRGFRFVYDSSKDALKYEPTHKLKNMGMLRVKIHVGGKKRHDAKKIANVTKGKKGDDKKK